METSNYTVRPTSILGPVLPDEMIWSYYARIMARFPTMSFDDLAGIFGGELPSHRKTFPTRLANLAAAFSFNGAPDVTALIDGHTFYPFALPEISEKAANQLKTTLADKAFPVGVPDPLLLPRDFKLRTCQSCVAKDQKANMRYWHRCHQVPFLQVCVIHGTPLFETNIYAGTKDPIPFSTVTQITPMEVPDPKTQQILAEAYRSLAFSTTKANGDQVRSEFARLLRRHRYICMRRVSPELTELLKKTYDWSSLAALGVMEGETGFRHWIRVGKIALVLHVLGEPFDKFMERAAKVEASPKLTARLAATLAHERALADRVNEFAPEIAERLKQLVPFRKITRWVIANELNPILGPGFSSNWSYKGAVKEALKNYAEDDLSYANRVISQMVDNPETHSHYENFSSCMAAFGLAAYLRHRPDLTDEARRIYISARSTIRG